MRSLRLIAAAAFVAVAAPAFAQGSGADDKPAAADPAQQRAIDQTYLDRCSKGAPKELCACVVAVADSQLGEPAERQVFYDFMMGDVDKAKTSRSMFSPEKNAKFNAALQKADVMLGNQCDRLKSKAPEQTEQPEPGKKL